jgi:hypothetical protein
MYDPFYYLPSGYTYRDHEEVVSTLVQCWLGKTDTRLMAMPPNNANYALLRELNPGWFVEVGTMSETHWIVYVIAAPKPAPDACAEASRAASR